MSFHPVYYIINGWPSVEKTIEMVDKYVEHGVKAIQIDLPSSNPYGESGYIQDRMRWGLEKYGGDYDVFLNAVREIRRRHPDLEIHQVLYNDIVDTIGLDKFIAYCKEIDVWAVMLDDLGNSDELNRQGIRTTDFIMYDLPDPAIDRAVRTKNLVMLRSNKDHPEWIPRDGMTTWKQRVAYIKNRGVEGPVYAVAGILTKEQLEEVKAAGAQGAYIGTVLMKLWDDEDRLWDMLDQFESVAE